VTDQYPTLPYTWTVDGLPFNAGGTGVARYAADVSGHRGQTGRRSNKRPRTAADGSYVGGVYRASRVIVFRRCWSVFGSPAERRAEQDRLADLFAGDPDELHDLVYADGDRVRVFRGVLDTEIEPVPVGVNGLGYDFSVYCPDPRAFSGNPDGSAIVTGPTGLDDRGASLNGTQWDGADGAGIQWDGANGSGTVYDTPGVGSGASGAVTLVNTGDAPTSVLLRIVATVATSFPSVQHPDGGRITYNGTLAAGSTLIVDTADGTITVNGVPTPGALLDADMFQLAPGSTVLRFSSSGLTDVANLWTTHYSAHWAG
jgi:hypothetical protein